jgi:hypothetical protein
MVTTIPDEQLYLHSNRVKGKVVVITGRSSDQVSSVGLISLHQVEPMGLGKKLLFGLANLGDCAFLSLGSWLV